jgi:hypothetical protein
MPRDAIEPSLRTFKRSNQMRFTRAFWFATAVFLAQSRFAAAQGRPAETVPLHPFPAAS